MSKNFSRRRARIFFNIFGYFFLWWLTLHDFLFVFALQECFGGNCPSPSRKYNGPFLMSSDVRYVFWYISLLSSGKKQRELSYSGFYTGEHLHVPR